MKTKMDGRSLQTSIYYGFISWFPSMSLCQPLFPIAGLSSSLAVYMGDHNLNHPNVKLLSLLIHFPNIQGVIKIYGECSNRKIITVKCTLPWTPWKYSPSLKTESFHPLFHVHITPPLPSSASFYIIARSSFQNINLISLS